MSRPFVPNPPAIVGEVVAGEAAEARRNLESIINAVNRSNFDIAEICHRIKNNHWYSPFTTWQEYAASLPIKLRKVQYLTRMAGVFEQLGIPRSTYEPLGVARCREITSLDPDAMWKDPETGNDLPVSDYIRLFVEQGNNIEMETLKQHVRVLKGFIGDNDLCWDNICFTRSVRDNVWIPAKEKAKALLGSVRKDDEGMSEDASDARAIEMIAVNFLNDENLQLAELASTDESESESENTEDQPNDQPDLEVTL